MTNFITYWIQRGMETDKQREEATRERIEKSMKGSVELLKRWDEPLLAAGYWNTRKSNVVNKGRHSEAAGGHLSAYDHAIADVQAARDEKAKSSGK